MSKPSERALERACRLVHIEQETRGWRVMVARTSSMTREQEESAKVLATRIITTIALAIDEAVAEERARRLPWKQAAKRWYVEAGKWRGGCHDMRADYELSMPCGHAQRYAVHGSEGTGYCALCELEAVNARLDQCAVEESYWYNGYRELRAAVEHSGESVPDLISHWERTKGDDE